MKLITKEGVVSTDLPQLTTPGIFGSGPDGSATLDGTNTYGWANKVGSGDGASYTLLRSVYLTALTVGVASPQKSITLKTNGFKIYCSGTVTLTKGSIVCDGVAAAASVAGTGFGTLASTTNPIPDPATSNYGGNGGTGGTNGTTGATGVSGQYLAPGFAGAGGQGGSGGAAGTGASNGTSPSIAAGSFSAFKNLTSPISGLLGHRHRRGRR